MMQTPQTPFNLPGLDSYPGGKGSERTVRLLINEIPPHRTYCEPFLGGGAVLRHIRPAHSTIGFDLSDQVLKLWSRAPKWCTVYKRDGLEFVTDHLFNERPDCNDPNLFLFIDPPYLNETLLTGMAPYAHRFTYDDHVRLLQALNRLQCNVMVCALPNLLYESMLHGWRTLQYENVTRRGLQTEQVWMNYAKPDVLHDARYVGDNFRERERIRRRGKGMVRQLASLKPLERQSVLEAIYSKFPPR